MCLYLSQQSFRVNDLNKKPNKSRSNDVGSTLLMEADGLMLAAEMARGEYPLWVVRMVSSLIRQYERWTPNSSFEDIIYSY